MALPSKAVARWSRHAPCFTGRRAAGTAQPTALSTGPLSIKSWSLPVPLTWESQRWQSCTGKRVVLPFGIEVAAKVLHFLGVPLGVKKAADAIAGMTTTTVTAFHSAGLL